MSNTEDSDLITVEAQEGRTVPFHSSALAGPGGTLAILKPGERADVRNTIEVRKAIRNGDLKQITKPAAFVPKTTATRTIKEG